MKKLPVITFIILSFSSLSQEKVNTTEMVSIEGMVKNPIKFSLGGLKDYKVKQIDSIVIYNHLMEPRRTIKNIKAVLLKDILDKSGFDVTLPKLLSEFYITCIASDNYKVVFSWNELFNSNVGDSVVIIIEADGKKAEQLPDRIAILSVSDHITGRRYIKGLQKIIVERVN
jgi:uncharacterized protein YbaA (DUF1428 family)